MSSSSVHRIVSLYWDKVSFKAQGIRTESVMRLFGIRTDFVRLLQEQGQSSSHRCGNKDRVRHKY